MHKATTASFLLLLLMAVGCGQEQQPVRASSNQPSKPPLYFDVAGFLGQETARLNQQHPAVEKQVKLRNGVLETTRVPQVDWTKELQIFQQADINKPALRGTYAVDSLTTPEGLTQRTYRRQPGQDFPVEQLSVLTEGNKLRTLTATLAQDNPLVYSQKKLELQCQDGHLTAYRVDGIQKLILFDSVRYSAQGRVQ
ncbi:hypothetical protein SAMN06265337_3541 [Hymenobacter gelipurpurascens]|uniref:Uncharacterized protein n=1 Tax=Hymenobacter gelipurpurascens TaxID=89968 RepID=A0A212UER6_9BACT|nr:hypothetical protein [Hymenobacter gelipurpurascens]SNC76745.1 hypothetical protein SAMN06265337_3541 [Hymenobacter gelipurpurascens]